MDIFGWYLVKWKYISHIIEIIGFACPNCWFPLYDENYFPFCPDCEINDTAYVKNHDFDIDVNEYLNDADGFYKFQIMIKKGYNK